MKIPMKLNSRLDVRIVRFFGSFKTTKINNFFIKSYFCLKWIFFKPFFVCNPLKSVFVFRRAICSILTIRSFSEIFNSIIRPISVNVINLINRPFSVYIKPCESMRCIVLSVNFNVNITSMVKVSCRSTNLDFWARTCPRKDARDGIVAEGGEKIFVGNFVHA